MAKFTSTALAYPSLGCKISVQKFCQGFNGFYGICFVQNILACRHFTLNTPICQPICQVDFYAVIYRANQSIN
ncbi:hypothetical protein ACFBZI_07800 [Moraxella sp. ZJ142]|uniref:hypothetical protein n=1 Tax=Moraxella marmotae TaxID=3344520 RepID=UPI0035D4B446